VQVFGRSDVQPTEQERRHGRLKPVDRLTRVFGLVHQERQITDAAVDQRCVQSDRYETSWNETK